MRLPRRHRRGACDRVGHGSKYRPASPRDVEPAQPHAPTDVALVVGTQFAPACHHCCVSFTVLEGVSHVRPLGRKIGDGLVIWVSAESNFAEATAAPEALNPEDHPGQHKQVRCCCSEKVSVFVTPVAHDMLPLASFLP